MRLALGISPCPNDTFVFHGLLSGAVRVPGVELEFELLDVQALNDALATRRFDVAKASTSAALASGAEWLALRAGAALGFGVGPLLLGAPGRSVDADGRIPAGARVLCPGERTTAHLLYRALHRGEGRVEQVVFSAILPALQRGEADFGVCIHEGRFTWQRYGLAFVEDLGATWEARARTPLPLGLILARRVLPHDVLRALDDGIRASLEHARAHRDEVYATMRRHAQELDDDALWKHVELYVNAWTRDLGREGREALARLRLAALECGALEADAPELGVLGDVPR
ncbi:MAG: MqnA/MqnD/SBP family protein [Planctomycetota bacterium]